MFKRGFFLNLFLGLLLYTGIARAQDHASADATPAGGGQITAFEMNNVSSWNCSDNLAYIKVSDNNAWYYFDTSTPGGKGMLASVLTAVSTGQKVRVAYLTNGHQLNCGGLYNPVAYIAFVL